MKILHFTAHFLTFKFNGGIYQIVVSKGHVDVEIIGFRLVPCSQNSKLIGY
jgi:hypothetical protein